ncbi:hypothetical protein GGR52DRAFT_569850 [Hypoxylon sp. FL1284]|nr:hypothetical protein GGR52DRAFT_569850 [Hypoxylon sp. FL1284]
MMKTWITAAALSRLAMASAGLSPSPFLLARNGSSGSTTGSRGILPCDALEAAGLGDRLLFPTDPDYEPQVETWYAANNRLRPYCFVLPQTAEEVSTTLTTLVNVNDGAGDWHIAVKSGGHGVFGTSSVANGVTIDLSHMNGSTYDPETNLAKIQPGGRWKNVYANLETQGVTATGGRDGDVGVGGFLLGGGNSFFTGRMGFGCDSVVNYEVVLANGTIINVSNTTNADLWHALKGGSSNFGIVTRFDMEALPTRELAYDIRFMSANYSDIVVDAVVDYTNQNQSLADNHLITYYAHDPSMTPQDYIACINVNTQGDFNAKTAFDKVKVLPAFYNNTVSQNMAQAAEGSQLPSNVDGTSQVLLFRNDLEILRACVKLHQELVETLNRSIDPKMFNTMMFFQPIPSYIGQIGKQRGPNVLGLDAIDANAILFIAGASVNPEAGDGAFAITQAATFEMKAKLQALMKPIDGDLGFLYLNYADPSQDPLGSYGAANIQTIRDVAAKYDPTGVFQYRIPGGFKISRTKCDRRSPCASCVTLNVACRSTRRAPEKRQRVVLSSRYDEAVEDVSRQLGDVKEMLHTLMLNRDASPRSVETAPTTATSSPPETHGAAAATRNTPPPAIIDEQVPSLSGVRDGFNGDSSFQSHLEATLAASELIGADALDTPPTTLSPQTFAELLHGGDTGPAAGAGPHHGVSAAPAPAAARAADSDLAYGKLPLPPLDATLKLLRLAKAERQRFFVDLPFFDEDEVVDKCRGVYFATEPVSIWTWIVVNVALHYLYFGAGTDSCRRMGTTRDRMRVHCAVLKANAEAAMQSLRLCSEPSTESCRALALLGTFYVKEGHITIAWRLFSSAARACLDLGFHRLPNEMRGKEVNMQREVFWYIYLWEKGLAITCGRTPIIHHYDVITAHPSLVSDRVDLPETTNVSSTYGAYQDYAILAGEIQRTLFSASARHASQEERVAHVRRFAAKIMMIQESVRSESPNWSSIFDAATALIHIKMYSLLTLVYRILPPSSPQAHPLQCSDECIEAARQTLSVLLTTGEKMLKMDPAGWSTLLNVVLSLVPFVSFVVLAGNAIATSSTADLALLSSILAIMAPIAADTPNIRKYYEACERFGRVASLIVSNSNQSSVDHKEYQEPDSSGALPLNTNGPAVGSSMANDADEIHMDFAFPMAQQDWDSAMTGFESELGNWDSRALTSTIEPYIANTGW